MWSKRKIKNELAKKGLSLQKAALEQGYSKSAFRVVLTKPWPNAEKALADTLNIPVNELFPERYPEAK